MIDFRDLNDNEHPDSEQLNSEETPVRFRDLDTLPEDPEAVDQNAGDEKRKLLYNEADRYLKGVFEAVKNRQAISVETGFQIVARLVETQPVRDVLFIRAIHEDDHYDLLINHSINVAILAVKLGAGLGLKKEHLIRLGMTALVHDVGTALIPERILYKKENLTEEEFKIMRERPKYTYRILKDLDDPFRYLADLAVQVYERIDGSGYPQGLKAEEIHEYAQIIGLVDVYEALIHSRPQRERYLHFSAVKEIIKTVKNCYQRRHLKALLSNISIFPIFSYVRLNSDAIGKVIETYPEQPMRPKLQIVFDAQGQRVLTERIINLPENPLLYIVDSVPEEDMDNTAQPF